jgi:hypothetical protein
MTSDAGVMLLNQIDSKLALCEQAWRGIADSARSPSQGGGGCVADAPIALCRTFNGLPTHRLCFFVPFRINTGFADGCVKYSG